MAAHTKSAIEKYDVSTAGGELVEEIAQLPPGPEGQKARRNHSFASKFAHFFIDSERFPVMDGYAIRMVKFHLGSENYTESQEHPYCAFVQNLQNLKNRADLNVSNRDLDHYLWMAGELSVFHENPNAEINGELKQLFNTRPYNTAGDLTALLPSVVDRGFRGEM